MKVIVFALPLGLALCTLAAAGTIHPLKCHAWAANFGWMDWRTAPATASVSEMSLSGLVWSANCGWINLGDGAPANGWSYSNTDGADCGLNLQPDGTLTGLAWGANIGWIIFEQSSGKPKLSWSTGEFSGFAWSANCGWIDLGGSRLANQTMLCVDTDLDEIADAWEWKYFHNLTAAGAVSDADHDGQPDVAEFREGTDPKNPASRMIVSLNLDGSDVQVSAENLAANRRYALETSLDLQLWTAASSYVPGFGPVAVFEATVDPAEPRRFWRFSARKPFPIL